jgi:inosose dehydratase
MASLGLTATELGPLGYLPADPTTLLDRHGLRLIAGFVPLVLHEPELDRAGAEQIAAMLANAGAEVFVAAAVADQQWSAPPATRDWARIAAHLHEVEQLAAGHGLTLALHPHVGTLIESADDVEQMLQAGDAGWCLDTGHLAIGGVDPAEFVRDHGERIVHVHLKDVDARVAERLRARELSLVQATQAGLFKPLGQGDAPIGRVVELLDTSGYERWLVLEQDTAITGQEPPVGRGPVLDVRTSIEYLHALAPAHGERVAQS